MLDSKTHRMLEHLGDGVYVYIDEHGNTVICTSDGETEKNIVWLDDSGVDSLERWLRRRRELVNQAVAETVEALRQDAPDGD